MKTVSPIELLVPGRIDLIAKYTYIENYVKHYDVKWFNNLYKAHIEALSGGNYTEPTNPAKGINRQIEKINAVDCTLLSVSLPGRNELEL